MSEDERKYDSLYQLSANADHLNAIDTPDPCATPTYEIMSGALIWFDEIRPDTPTEVIWALRPLWAYRTNSMLGKVGPAAHLWEKGLILFPNWVGFRPERREATDELLAEYHRGNDSLTRCLDAVDKSVDELTHDELRQERIRCRKMVRAFGNWGKTEELRTRLQEIETRLRDAARPD